MAYEHFTEDELRCKCGCNRQEMDHPFMVLIDVARDLCGFPWPVASGYRCPDHDAEVGSSALAGAGPHTHGKALDIRISNPANICLIIDALIFTGIFSWNEVGDPRGGLGINMRPDGSIASIHIDALKGDEATRPMFWIHRLGEEA